VAHGGVAAHRRGAARRRVAARRPQSSPLRKVSDGIVLLLEVVAASEPEPEPAYSQAA
jgi:hypothetical protein